MQDNVAAAIIDALDIHVSVAPVRRRPTDNNEAYDYFLKARVALSQFSDDGGAARDSC